MDKRKKLIIIIVSAIVFFLILLLIFWLLSRRPTIPAEAPPLVNEGFDIPADLPAGLTNTGININATPAEQRLEAELKAVSFTFAERFGSYSNQGGFYNLESLNSIVTERMKTWINNYKETELNKDQNFDDYYGITTNTLSVSIVSLEERLGRAETLVKTQRLESKGTTLNPRPFYQDIKLQLVKVGELWKVDFATWQ